MLNGDISNEAPKALLVVWPWLGTSTVTVGRRGVVRRHDEYSFEHSHDVMKLGRLWTLMDLGLRGDLAILVNGDARYNLCFQVSMREYVNHENLPFASVRSYSNRQDVASTLAKRHDLIGVVDDPKFGLTYGSSYYPLD